MCYKIQILLTFAPIFNQKSFSGTAEILLFRVKAIAVPGILVCVIVFCAFKNVVPLQLLDLDTSSQVPLRFPLFNWFSQISKHQKYQTPTHATHLQFSMLVCVVGVTAKPMAIVVCSPGSPLPLLYPFSVSLICFQLFCPT